MVNSYLKGICYSPTWTTWSPPYLNTGPDAQFSDSDFTNDSFVALWGSGTDGSGNKYRDDVGTMAGAGFNLIRLYDWGATRGWNQTTGVGTAHLNFLDYCSNKGLEVIVPISNYFLSSNQYAWGTALPDKSYSFGSAPAAIQSALSEFISSVVKNGTVHPAVHSFSVGNEIDINDLVGQGGPAVDPASRLARVNWWIVNLQRQISLKKYRLVLITSPISNADQGNPQSGQSQLSYWFQAIVNGVTESTLLPNGTTGGTGTTFSEAWPGVGTTIGFYNLWYYNSVNIYKTGSGLTTTLGQYDHWVASTSNSTNWPGEQFSLPLLLTEIGSKRLSNDPFHQATQASTITKGIALAVKNYLAGQGSSNLIGYCLYEFSDEVTVQANWGLNMVEPGLYPKGQVLYSAATGPTQVSYPPPWPSVNYPVDQLFPVVGKPGETLMTELKDIFD